MKRLLGTSIAAAVLALLVSERATAQMRTAVTLQSTHSVHTNVGDRIFLMGKVSPVMPDGATAPVNITVIHPDGYVQASDWIPTDSSGRYKVSVTARAYGYIQVKIRAFEHDAAYRPSGSELMIPVVPLSGMAIVIAGAGDSALFPVIEQLSDSVVKTFRRRHFVDESCGAGCVFNRIWYLHPDSSRDIDADSWSDVDAAPTLANLSDAVRIWAASLMKVRDASGSLNPQAVLQTPLTIYVIGSADGRGLFLNPSERLDAATLDGWLDSLELSIQNQFVSAGVTPPASLPIHVIVDSPSSGDFIVPLSKKGRIVIASTTAGGTSYYASGGSVSFSSYFLSRIASGHYIHPSFAYAQLMILQNVSLVRQAPQLEASGNGVANEISDELETASVPLENRLGSPRPPRLKNALGAVTLRDINAASLWVYVEDPEDDVVAVEASITPPDGSYEETHVVQLKEGTTSGRWEGTYEGFFGNGTYTVSYTARDRTGQAAHPLVKTVDRRDTVAPLNVTELGAEEKIGDAVTLRWATSESYDTQGYRVYLRSPDSSSEILVTSVINAHQIRIAGIPWLSIPGAYTFRITAYDRVPAESSGATIVVGEIDKTAPALSVSGDLVAEATGATGAAVSYPAPSASDNVAVTSGPACSPVSGSIFPLGTTAVTCLASDAAGNVTSATFKVSVVDTTPPTLIMPANLTIVVPRLQPGGVVTYKVSASDAVAVGRPRYHLGCMT